jgi:protein-S-isoprenylcysteine O-methyltransferase Ste14
MIRLLEWVFVWIGGGLFAGSLSACVYRYLVTWETPTRLTFDMTAAVSDILLFALFALHHSVFARPRVKAQMARVVPDRLLRSVYVWTASLLLFLVLALWQPIGGHVYQVSGWLAVGHAGIQLAGLGLIVFSVAKLDGLELAGIRSADLSRALHVGGPYRWVRHPLYLGWLLCVFGTPLMTADRLLFAVVTSVYVLVAVPMEERSLAGLFGEEYARYAVRVRWRLVPYVY